MCCGGVRPHRLGACPQNARTLPWVRPARRFGVSHLATFLSALATMKSQLPAGFLQAATSASQQVLSRPRRELEPRALTVLLEALAALGAPAPKAAWSDAFWRGSLGAVRCSSFRVGGAPGKRAVARSTPRQAGAAPGC